MSASKINASRLNSNKNTKIVRSISWLIEKWSKFVADYSIFLIILCSFLSILGTIKIIITPNENDITGYTPYGARARDEFDIMTQYFSKNGHGISIFFLIIPKNGENVLRKNVLEEALKVEKFISTNFTLTTENGKSENFQEFCTNFCQINEPFSQFAKSFIVGSLSDRIRLDYPISTIYSRRFSIQQNFFGIKLAENGTKTQTLTNLESSKMIALQLRSERKSDWSTQMVKNFENEVTDYFDKQFFSSEIRVLTLSTSFVESEVVRAGMSLLPFLIVGFIIMAVVSSMTTFLSAFYMKQISIHKFSLAIAACICPFMACGTGLGLLFLCGVRFGSVLCITPFLILAIGVDDSYLMIHSWQRITAERRLNPIANDSSANRLSHVLIDTVPAILISALTNIFADIAGCFTSSPEVSLLAYGNMICIFIDFIYQITFYSAIMTIAGNFEIRDENQKRLVKTIICGEEKDVHSFTSSTSFDSLVKQKVANFLNFYISLIINVRFQLLIVFSWILYLAISIYGITILNINLSPKKLFMEDSSLCEMDDLRVKYFVPHFYVCHVFVNQPGNLSNFDRLIKLDQFVRDMERINGSWGPQGTNYFIRDFREYQNELKNEEEENENLKSNQKIDFNLLPTFLNWPEYSFWKGFIQFHNESSTILLDKFFMTFAVHGQELQSWPARGTILREWRNVVDKYRDEFNLSVYSDDGIYVDLIENMPTDTWQSSVATLTFMALICFLFMWDISTVSVATIIIASVMTGILGILSLTGTDLDPIVMSSLIISIGFSVDIPAHITYHYHISLSNSIEHRLKLTLASVGFPALQASLSTSLCVLSLKFTSVYMSNIFVKTMIVCMILCISHALILLPVLFAIFNRFFCFFFRSAKISIAQ